MDRDKFLSRTESKYARPCAVMVSSLTHAVSGNARDAALVRRGPIVYDGKGERRFRSGSLGQPLMSRQALCNTIEIQPLPLHDHYARA